MCSVCHRGVTPDLAAPGRLLLTLSRWLFFGSDDGALSSQLFFHSDGILLALLHYIFVGVAHN
jgi:hypothetical protein